MPKITTKWQRFEALTADELYELLRFRQNIFVVEQGSPYPDLDSLDQSAWHLVARMERRVAGYLRLTPIIGPPPLVRIGRIAVSPDLRRHGIGRRLMEEALRLCRKRYAAWDIALSAQAHLAPFYQSFGFAPTGEPYAGYSVLHVHMRMLRDTT